MTMWRLVRLSLLVSLVGCVHQENSSDVDPVEATASDPYVAILLAMREVTGNVPYFVRAADQETQDALLALDDELARLDVFTDAERAASGDTPATVELRNTTRDEDGTYRGEIFALRLDPETMTGGTDTQTYTARCRRALCKARLEFKSEGYIVPPPPAPPRDSEP